LKRDLISAFEVFRGMREEGIRPTHSTIEMLMRGCTMNMRKYESFDQAGTEKQNEKSPKKTLHQRPQKNKKPKTKQITSRSTCGKRAWSCLPHFHSIGSSLISGRIMRPSAQGFCLFFSIFLSLFLNNCTMACSSKAGHIRKALDFYEQMTKNAFTLPSNVISNSLIEGCVNTKQFDKALKVAEEMDEIRQGMWLKGKYRADAVTFSLALKAGIEGEFFHSCFCVPVFCYSSSSWD